MIDAIIYDTEVKCMIQGGDEERIPGLKYCGGWHDYAGMGISCIGAYDYVEDRYRLFMDDNMGDFERLVDSRQFVIGYNSRKFDNNLCEAHGIFIPADKSWDLQVAIWEGAGLGPTFKYPSHSGYGLDAVAFTNLRRRKTGDGGALAPAHWQRGEYGKLIDYCLNDVFLTRGILDIALMARPILCPKTGKELRLDTSLLTHVPAEPT